MRELFTSYLTELGATCDQAVDGEEALHRARRTPYDALVLDLTMPRMGGLEVTRLLRSAPDDGGRVHIVGVSAHAADVDRIQAVGAGMNAFLIKPVALPALAQQTSAELPAERQASLRARLAERFRGEPAATQGSAIAEAIARADWGAVKARAHYLKSSAGVVHDDRLYQACVAVEDAADRADESALRAAWAECNAALQP